MLGKNDFDVRWPYTYARKEPIPGPVIQGEKDPIPDFLPFPA